jgi:hypothetical protein
MADWEEKRLFVRNMHLSMWMAAFLVIGSVLLLGSGCGGGDGSEGGSSTGTQNNKGGAQATQDDLDAALEKSFKETDAPGVVAAVETPDYTWCRPRGWPTALVGSR